MADFTSNIGTIYYSAPMDSATAAEPSYESDPRLSSFIFHEAKKKIFRLMAFYSMK